MQNNILEQAKLDESGAGYLERGAFVKGSLFGGTALKNDKFRFQENFWLHGTEPAFIHHAQRSR